MLFPAAVSPLAASRAWRPRWRLRWRGGAGSPSRAVLPVAVSAAVAVVLRHPVGSPPAIPHAALSLPLLVATPTCCERAAARWAEAGSGGVPSAFAATSPTGDFTVAAAAMGADASVALAGDPAAAVWKRDAVPPAAVSVSAAATAAVTVPCGYAPGAATVAGAAPPISASGGTAAPAALSAALGCQGPPAAAAPPWPAESKPKLAAAMGGVPSRPLWWWWWWWWPPLPSRATSELASAHGVAPSGWAGSGASRASNIAGCGS